MNNVRGMSAFPRRFQEYIMQLHTGESISAADWSWEQRRNLGQRILTDLAEDTLIELDKQIRSAQPYNKERLLQQFQQLLAHLELDGYLFRGGKLYITEATVFDTEEATGTLLHLVNLLGFSNVEIIRHHLNLADEHYTAGKWDDSIGNARKVLEAITQEAAAAHSLKVSGQPLAQRIYDSPRDVRDYLESVGLLVTKEKEAIAKVYGLMSETGGHPYMAEKDQARLMRHLALTLAEFVLLRLQGKLTAITS